MDFKTYMIIAAAVIFTAFIIIRTHLHKKKLGPAENENESWKFGFYFNRSDKRVFLPKRYGMGITVNFANPLSYLFFAGIIILAFIFN